MRCNIQVIPVKMFRLLRHDFSRPPAYILLNWIPQEGLPKWIFPD
jgi:hypothetical protein